jgi:hypothetical protein
MIGNNSNAGVMERYTVYKSALYNANPTGYLPPNYHLKRARQNEESVQRTNAPEDRFDFFTPDAFVGSRKGEREEESLLSLFKKLNERLFGKKYAPQSESIERPSAATNRSKMEDIHNIWNENKSEDSLPPQMRNTWWNVVDIQDKSQKPGNAKMCQNLESWCQSEYSQTRDEDDAFYTPQELRDRISVLKEINGEVKSIGPKFSKPAQVASEPWDLVTPLPLQPKGLSRYEAMEDEDNYKSLWNSSTVEAVA